MGKTIQEINQKIKQGQAVIVTANEVIDVVREKGLSAAAKTVDVVTTGTFGPMCSSGAYFNIGHSKPRIKIGGGRAYLNDVPTYPGYAAVDLALGMAAMPDDDPRNRQHPGDFNYGGAHVVQELLEGKAVRLVAQAYGTDCYPRKKLETWISLEDMNEAVLFNMRNAYQNYNVAVNLSDKTIYTYMGVLKPRLGNANYCSAGQLSPLMNDPLYKTIGIGTRIFLAGGVGYVAWQGTQHNPGVPRAENGTPKRPSGTLAVIGDLKGMDPRWLVASSFWGYGVTATIGIGVPIPILDEETLRYTTVTDADIYAPIVDYSEDYPQRNPRVLGEVSYAELRGGQITVEGKTVNTASLSSYPRAVEIAGILKDWIVKGDFMLSEAVTPLAGPDDGVAMKPLEIRPLDDNGK